MLESVKNSIVIIIISAGLCTACEIFVAAGIAIVVATALTPPGKHAQCTCRYCSKHIWKGALWRELTFLGYLVARISSSRVSW